jgi:undecaprenyl-diphosphatase
VFAALAARYADTSLPGWLDRRSQALIDSIVDNAPYVPTFLIAIGDQESVVAAAFLLLGLSLWLGRGLLALLAVLGPGATGLVTTFSKPLIGRTLNGELAYPSGHAAGATAVGVVAAMLLASLLPTERVAAKAMILIGVPIVVGGGMSVLLVAGRDHYPTDTIGGFCVAVAVVVGLTLALDGLADLRSEPDRG